MQVEELSTMDRSRAAAMLERYKEHVASHNAEDKEITAIYEAISRGHQVIDAHQSIRNAGFDERGRPKLAMCRAHLTQCFFRRETVADGVNAAAFREKNGWSEEGSKVIVRWPELPNNASPGRAVVPIIPVHVRPKASNLRAYSILWEADWHDVPVDPMLLRRISSNAWIVVAAWDLTPIEQAVLRNRLSER